MKTYRLIELYVRIPNIYIFFKYVNVFYFLLFFICTHVRFTKTHRSFILAITFDWFAYFENGKKPAQADIKNYMVKKKVELVILRP